MFNTEAKANIISKFQRDPKDTGSSDVQIALLSARIEYLTEHLKKHKKDFHSRRGLIKLINRRRKLLDYIKRTNLDKYLNLIKELGLRR